MAPAFSCQSSDDTKISGLIAAAEAFARLAMRTEAHDASHDFSHVERVRRCALQLAEEEGLPATSQEIVEIAALLHDVGDHKYSGCEEAGPRMAFDFLTSQGYDQGKAQIVADIIVMMGFKDELDWQGTTAVLPELAVVQDADRLDAIGAIGIARCLTFGGARHRILHDPSVPPRNELTKDEYLRQRNTTTINHFYEKLVTLKDRMKTKAGRKRAEGRHAFLLEYLEHFQAEWEEGCKAR